MLKCMNNVRETQKDLILEAADQFAHNVYQVSRKLPKDELYGITSQLRRAALSVPLNLVEGHARGTDKNRLNFCRMAFGSLKESQYLLGFCIREELLTEADTKFVHDQSKELARMLWRKLETLTAKVT